MKRYFAWLMTLALTAGLLCGCGAKSADATATVAAGNRYPKEELGFSVEMDAAEAPEMMQDSMVSNRNPGSGVTSSSNSKAPESTAAEVNPNQKLVRKLWIDAETENLDTLLSQVDARIKQLGGYCEAREIYNGSNSDRNRYRTATLTIRIPAEQLDQFTDHLAGISNITSSNETTEDITLTYIAVESRIKALQTEHDRLLELLAKAETMSDLLEIESRLTNVRADMERVTSQLKLYENMVSYGTVRLNLTEVKEYTILEEEPETIWQRIGIGFMDSLKAIGDFFKEAFVFVIVALPYLSLVCVAVAAIVIVIKLRRKRKK